MAANSVRVDPPSVEFNDVKVGHVYKTTVTVTNVGKTLKKIRIKKPTTKLFKFTSASPAASLAPGLSVSGLIEFTPDRDEEVRDCLLLDIDEMDAIEIPLSAFCRTCSFLIDSVIDFGCVAASSQVIRKRHPMTNQGSAPGVFQVQHGGHPALTLSPFTGVIAAGATQWLQVDLRTDRPRQIQEKALVKLQDGSSVVLSINAEVVDQQLEVFDTQGAPLPCLWFGPVYFGTSRVENVVLKNNSPQACDWVCLLQDAAAGTEVGTDLQRSTDAALLEKMERCSQPGQNVSQIVACFPKQGHLGPNEISTLSVCFSPVCKRSRKQRAHRDAKATSASRHDYCLFLLFESLRSKHGFTHCRGNSSVELAVVGSGLPVSLVPSPSHQFNFLSCVIGERVDMLCVLQNLCPQLPVNFHFHKLAHFSTEPSAGIIAPDQCQDVVLSFNARQQGSFQVCQKLEILGHVCQSGDNASEEAPALQLRPFYTIALQLSAVCHSETIHPVPKLNPGITPAVTNPAGCQPRVRTTELAQCREKAHAAILSADRTTIHTYRTQQSQNKEGEEFLAFPNDRSASIRPPSPHTQYRTIFTGVCRYRYVDTDYAFTEEEAEQRRLHRQIYADFINQLRKARLQRMKERQQIKVEDDELDIGIAPSQGLVPPELNITNLKICETEKTKTRRSNSCLPAVRRSCPHDVTSSTRQVNSQVTEVVNAAPSSSQEVADCNRVLTAQELYQVVIRPLMVDFGEVCAQSVCVQKLELINRLSVYVWIELEMDCPELQGSSPLSHVLPPCSQSTLPLTFQSNKLGHFYRPVPYSVNQQHPGQILVQAQVVPVALELSTNLLVLRPNEALLAHSGYRSSVTIRNKRNHTAEFTWRPVVTKSGIQFSVLPAAGTVEAFCELDCEVVWYPSFSSSPEGDFDLCVHEGNTQRLHCVAKGKPTSVHFAEKRVIFESVPLSMPSVRTAVLRNTGQNHSYYQVLDACPMPGMMVSPSKGVVPCGGQAELQIHFSPDSAIKFDTNIEIALKNMKSVELRVGGSVEPLNLHISAPHFQFSGVHVGSRRMLSFTLTNRSPAAARLTFDLSQYPDFALQLPQPSAMEQQTQGVTVVEVQGHQSVDCSLVFSPTQAASYEFDLPLLVNGVSCGIASPSPTLTSASCSLSSNSRNHIIRPFPKSVSLVTGLRHIHATVLLAPLEMSPSNLQFHVESLVPQSDIHSKMVELKSVCKESVCWWFDCSPQGATSEGGAEGKLLTAFPSSGILAPGQSVCLAVSIRTEDFSAGSGRVTKLSLPLYLGDKEQEGTGAEEGRQPYRELSVTVTVQHPRITIHPPELILTPVPLDTETAATLTLLAVGYPGGTTVSAEVDEVELKDGSKTALVSVVFPQGNSIPAQKHPAGFQNQEASATSLTCSVSFSSAVPLSTCTYITFTDHLHNRFQMKLYAVTDNCLLTVWPYMALHRSQQQIVLQTGVRTVQTAAQCCQMQSPTSVPDSSSSSFYHNTSSKNTISDSFPDSDSLSDYANKDEEVCPRSDTSASLGVPQSPAANSEEGLYFRRVLLAVERWFSFFGWPGGPHPISVPHTLRRLVPKIQTNPSSGRTYRVNVNINSRSVFDMLRHLTGQQVPGIPHCCTFSGDIDQRTDQLLQQHEAMLAFLRVQGGCLCHIKPAYLLDIEEFNHWRSLQLSEKGEGQDYSRVDYESLSKRCWTDVLLQIYKVLVLCCVSESHLNTNLSQKDANEILPVGLQLQASNVYSLWELQLLSWLNTHYQGMKSAVWSTGVVPPARWVVNFDLDLADGLVMGAVLAAHCPYLICSHFRRMYTSATSLDQIFHNNSIIVQAFTTLCLNIDIQPTDLSNPNPVQMLMLCVHLYKRLPQYQPVCTITLSGGLHSTFTKQVCLKNPSSQVVKYQAFVLGEDARLFSLPDGSAVTIPPNASTKLTIQYSCSFLQPMEAVLLLVSSSAFGLCGTALTFNLKTHVSDITPAKTVECKCPCCQLKLIQLPIRNRFKKKASFRVILLESMFNPLEPENPASLVQQASSKICPSAEEMTSGLTCEEEMDDVEAGDFLSTVTSVCLNAGETHTLNIHYLPFCPGNKYCFVLLVCPQVGDMLYVVKATAKLPLPSPLTARPGSNIVSLPTTSGGPGVCEPVLRLHCLVGQVCDEVLHVPLVNMGRERALAVWGQLSMSAEEHRRRTLTQTMHSSTVRASTLARKLTKQQVQLMRSVGLSDGVEYSVAVSLPLYFKFPPSITMPVRKDAKIQLEDNPADGECVDVPFQFKADSAGQFACQLVLRSWWDTRVYLLEALVSSRVETS